MKVMFLDESGDHDLVRIDPNYSIFVLGGIIVDRTYARTVMEPRVRAFKREWLGTENIILHSVDIARGRNGFERLRADRRCREKFLSALGTLMTELDYQVVACVIHKDRHVATYGERSIRTTSGWRSWSSGSASRLGTPSTGALSTPRSDGQTSIMGSMLLGSAYESTGRTS